ncbi:MAG: hypothetical protein ACPGU5_00855 [Lishizhenia sp.]
MSDTNTPIETKSNAGVWILTTILGFIVAGIFIFLWSGERKAKEEVILVNTQLSQEMEGMNQALSGYIDGATNDLRSDFQEMLATYDALIEKDATKADSLNAQKAKISQLLEELNDTKKRSYRQINKLKTENEALRGIMKGYLYQIDSLNTLNFNLTTRLDETSNQLSVTQQERDELAETAARTQALVAAGAKLSAYNFNCFAYRFKVGGGDIDETNRARRADGFKAEFTVSANKIAEAGNKMIYIQVIDPNGNVIYTRSNNTTSADGKTILYSDKREINYQKQAIDVAIVFNLQGKEIDKGNYTIKVYADGTLIGKDSITLK